MKLELSRDELTSLVEKQLDSMFTFDRKNERELLSKGVDNALLRTRHCFSPNQNKYYHRDGDEYFNPFQSAQYCIFLYFLSNDISTSNPGASTLADRIYYLNKCLNGLDLFHEVAMPKVFFLDHPVGTVLGRAKYGERFAFSQNCTVGNNHGKFPTFGDNVRMFSGSKIVGNCHVGDNVYLSANTYVKDVDIPSCSIVFGSSPNLIIKTKNEDYFKTV